MTGFQWLVVTWLSLLTAGLLKVWLSTGSMALRHIEGLTAVRDDTARAVTMALIAHSDAPFDEAHPIP